MSKDVWVCAEVSGGKVIEFTYNLIDMGRTIAERLGCGLSVIVIGGSSIEGIGELQSSGVDQVLLCSDPTLEIYNPEVHAEALLNHIQQLQPDVILFSQTTMGTDLGGTISAKLNVPFVSNCSDAEISSEGAVLTRLWYKGKLHGKVRLSGNVRPLLLSLVETPSKKAETTRKGDGHLVQLGVKAFEPRIKITTIMGSEPDDVDLSKADVIVAYGLGIGSQEKTNIVKELAKQLGGIVACTRPIVDREWMPYSRQVGISGKKVKPKLYVACGISGAIEHVMGMMGAGTVLAINTDPNAPIFKYADFGVIGDIHEVVPFIIEELRTTSKA